MKLYANLHTHSNHSDGPYSPEKLVQTAKAEGYKAIALTDHDTATGFAQLEAASIKEGMEYILAQSHSQQQRLDDYNYMIFIQSHLPTFRQIKSLKVGRIMEEFNRYVYFTFLPSVV